MRNELYISVDVEASGPVPGVYSMLSLGACVVGDPARNFYVEFKPLSKRFDPRALAVAGLDPDELARSGQEPARAMRQFDEWLEAVRPMDTTLVFCAYPLAFDWMFVAYYFHRFLGRNPFGYSGFDLKSFYMGVTGKNWTEAGTFSPKRRFDVAQDLTHNAREDAIAQAELMTRLLEFADEERRQRNPLRA
jgi:DNA polymerase III epsilon subunit-like protein